MTLPEYYAACRYWRKHPPAHKLLAAFVGYKAPPDEPQDADFEAVKARHADWFANPARFFAGSSTSH